MAVTNFQIILQNHFNDLCCSSTPITLGRITLTRGMAEGLYSDLASAEAFIQQYTNAVITDSSLVGDVFKFTVPHGSDFSITNGFLQSLSTYIEDPDGRITVFGEDCFLQNSENNILGNVTFGARAFMSSGGNNILGNCTFGGASFNSATGNNTVNNIILSDPFSVFANNYTGTMNITGNIGTTESAEYPSFFIQGGNATINTAASKQTSNTGNTIEGDLDTAITNGATVNFVL